MLRNGASVARISTLPACSGPLLGGCGQAVTLPRHPCELPGKGLHADTKESAGCLPPSPSRNHRTHSTAKQK